MEVKGEQRVKHLIKQQVMFFRVFYNVISRWKLGEREKNL